MLADDMRFLPQRQKTSLFTAKGIEDTGIESEPQCPQQGMEPRDSRTCSQPSDRKGLGLGKPLGLAVGRRQACHLSGMRCCLTLQLTMPNVPSKEQEDLIVSAHPVRRRGSHGRQFSKRRLGLCLLTQSSWQLDWLPAKLLHSAVVGICDSPGANRNFFVSSSPG
jgi:hypothetical protein